MERPKVKKVCISTFLLQAVKFSIHFEKSFPPVSTLKKTIFALGLAVMGTSILAAQTGVVTVGIYGYTTVQASAGGRVVAPVFVKDSIYAGYASIAGNTFSATGLTGSALGPTSYTDRPNAPRYYLEILSGAFAGYTYDITANDTNTITVFGLPIALDGQTGVSITVRPHVTLGDLANASSGLVYLADAFTLYRSNSVKSSYYYASSGVVGDDFATPADQAVIYPGTGVIVNNVNSASFILCGAVMTNQLVVPIHAGETLIAPVAPMAGKVSAQNLASILDPYSDSASLIGTNGALGILSFYSDGSSLLDQNYSPVNPSNAPDVVTANGFIINASSERSWTNLPIF